jgi:hypothetical protein
MLWGILELFSLGGLFILQTYRDIRYTPADRLSEKHISILEDFLSGNSTYVQFSPSTGWAIKPNGVSENYRANGDGIRSDRAYQTNPPPNIKRISTFGDSYTHCDYVKNEHTWQVYMEALDPGVETINFGVGGFGLDQAYLRYKEFGQRFRSHIVLIGYMSENLYRHVNTFRPFYVPTAGIPLAKPRFCLKEGTLTLIPNPIHSVDAYRGLLDKPKQVLRDLGKLDFYYQKKYKSGLTDWSPLTRLLKITGSMVKSKIPRNSIEINGFYNIDSEAFRITCQLFDTFYQRAKADGSIPVICIFPDKNDVARFKLQNDKRYSPLLIHFADNDYTVIDMMDAFSDYETGALFENHYSPFANQLVAAHILNVIGSLE